jgi:hypothetical protein
MGNQQFVFFRLSMHPKTDTSKIFIDKLLNTYSIDSIISIFHSIDEKIIEIIKSSSKDFIQFSSTFRKYYKEINLISANLLRLYTCFDEAKNNTYATKIGSAIENLEQQLKGFKSLIDFSKKIHDYVLKNLELIYIPANNFDQNLNTLKLLSANLKLDVSEYKMHADTINSNIENLLTAYPDFIENLKKLKKFVSNSNITIESLKTNYLDSAYKILSFCRKITDIILSKQHASIESKSVLESILKQTQENSSIIIINLQYQDNVKQKIEHVKQIHAEIIKKLSVLAEKKDQPDYVLTRAKLFLQVKELASLQSAQMVFANHEYQKAVDIIISRFIHMSDQMEKVYSLFMAFSAKDKLDNINGMNADINIRREVNLNNEIDAIHNIFRLQTEGIIQRITNFSHSFGLLSGSSLDFLGKIRGTKPNGQNPTRDESVPIPEQMSDVADELFNTIHYIKSVSDKNFELISSLKQKYSVDYLESKCENNQKQEVKVLSTAFRELNYLNREILHVFNSNTNYRIMSTELKKTIESIGYFKHFENETGYIVNRLNEISDKMKIGDANRF